MKKIWKAVLVSWGGYRWNHIDGPSLGITVKISGRDQGVEQREAGRLVDIPLTRQEAVDVIGALTHAVEVYDRQEAMPS